MLEIKFTAKFKKDFKRAKKQGKDNLQALRSAQDACMSRSIAGKDARSCAVGELQRP